MDELNPILLPFRGISSAFDNSIDIKEGSAKLQHFIVNPIEYPVFSIKIIIVFLFGYSKNMPIGELGCTVGLTRASKVIDQDVVG